jgi:glucose-6-phosphate 1-epimerase
MKPSIEALDFHGIPAYRLNGPGGSSAIVSRFGAQVLSWVTPEGRERLYLSEKAVFDGSAPIRGGVPVCFPQFAAQCDLPKHGFVRTREWALQAERASDDFALLTLEFADDEATRALWPHAFQVEMTIMLEADRLDLELGVFNPGTAAIEFTAALHTYLKLVQVEDAALEGLRGYEYCDKLDGDAVKRETGVELLVESEVDRIYHEVKRPLLLQAGNHSLGIHAQGFPDVVVWNPWESRCAGMPDLPADGWRHMLCVEAAAARQPVVLPAGEEWYGRQTLVVV